MNGPVNNLTDEEVLQTLFDDQLKSGVEWKERGVANLSDLDLENFITRNKELLRSEIDMADFFGDVEKEVRLAAMFMKIILPTQYSEVRQITSSILSTNSIMV